MGRMEDRQLKKVARWNFDNYQSELGFKERLNIYLWKFIWRVFLRIVQVK